MSTPVTSSVTGNRGSFVLGRSLSEGAAQIDDYFGQRLATEFDAIFVPAGKQVALLIQKEISIDYNPDGRKLNYVTAGNGLQRRTLD